MLANIKLLPSCPKVNTTRTHGVPCLADAQQREDVYHISDADTIRGAFETPHDSDLIVHCIVLPRYTPLAAKLAQNPDSLKDMARQLIACIHDLRFRANLLHRNISEANIMHTERDGKDCFILMDCGSTVAVDLNGQPLAGEVSPIHVGTLPFMAYELVDNMYRDANATVAPQTGVVHCVRHDFESVFWVLMWCALTVVKEEDIHTRDSRARRQKRMDCLASWHRSSYNHISKAKSCLLADPGEMLRMPLSPSFEHLRGWIVSLYKVFFNGLWKKRDVEFENLHKGDEAKEVTFEQFETWHGMVTRQTLEEAMRDIETDDGGV